MKTTIILVFGTLAVVASLLVLRHLRTGQPPVVVSSPGGPTIEKLQRLSHLVTSRVYVVDVLIGEGEGCRGAWLIRGDALLAIDLNHAKITEKNEETRKATIWLPQPEIIQARVDHEKTRTWEVRTTTWISWNAKQDKLRDAVLLQAQRLVGQAAGAKENVEQAKRAAEVILRALFEQCGWEVTVVFEETPSSPKHDSSSSLTAAS